MTILNVRHVTTYQYRRPVEFGVHRMMFRPRDSFDQRLIGSTLRITPEPAEIHWIHDVFGNCVSLARFERAADELRFESGILLDHTPFSGPDFRTDEHARMYPFLYSPDELPDLLPFISPQYVEPGRSVENWARQFLSPPRPIATANLLMTIACAIAESFTYQRRTAPGTQAPSTTLRLRRGTCRDFALFMMEAVRSLGFAARFVSGYLYVADRDGPHYLGGGSTHAWCQVYLPGAGWVEFDPTNGIVGNRDLIRVAVARDPAQALPLSGTYFGTSSDDLGMTVEVDVKSESAAGMATTQAL
jgi:transglutaminase-like putative cysteine protease